MSEVVRSGCGTEESPYRSVDGTAGLQCALDKLRARGGSLNLECGRYDLEKPVVIDTSSLCLSGGVWACNADPNGVFESKFGTKVRANGREYPCLIMGCKQDPVTGSMVRDLGFQGDITGMDTRPLVDFVSPEKAAGICFDTVRNDQCGFSRLAFCGLGCAVAAIGNAELDACLFENLNADGCGIGVWFAPRASYYTRFRSCVIADNPYYGFYLGAEGKHIHNLEITDCYFVRNGGAFSGDSPMLPAAVFFDHANQCALTNCIFDAPGVFWNYDEAASQNNQRQPSAISIPALRIIGNQNRIRGNTFLNSSADSIMVEGNGNILMGNIADGNVRICGEGNTISSLVFTKPEARLILEGKAQNTTVIYGVEPWRIVKEAPTV